MAVKIAINGFGRIGRLVFRAIAEQGMIGKDVEVVAVGDIVPADNLAYLLKYDSTQGRFQGEVTSKKSAADKAEDDVLVVNGKEIKVVSAKTPAELPWMLEPVQVSARDGLYRVRLGPYRNREEASAIADKVRESLGFAPAISR